jgi:hypothetical protein
LFYLVKKIFMNRFAGVVTGKLTNKTVESETCLNVYKLQGL